MVTSRRLDIELCERLANGAASGDAAATNQLLEHLWPAWLDIVRASRSLRALGQSDDHVHNVVARLVQKIGRAEGYGLRHYAPWRERHPEKTFEDWLRIVTANVVRDYVREHVIQRPGEATAPSVKRLLNEFAASPLLDELGVRPPFTAAQTARELIEYAREHLPGNQLQALSSWLEGQSFEEIEVTWSAPAGTGAKLVRAAIAALRRRFAGGADEIDPDGA